MPTWARQRVGMIAAEVFASEALLYGLIARSDAPGTKSIRLEESPAYRESIFTFAPKSSGAYEYYSLTEEILSRV